MPPISGAIFEAARPSEELSRLDARASVSRLVSGDFATTANLALVVKGVPTSGENTKISGASGASGSTSVPVATGSE